MKRLSAVLLLVPALAAATDYYVAGAGNDGNSGLSPASPFRTIQKAADLTQPGDTVNVMDGEYTNACPGCDVVSIFRSGTAEAWIAFRAVPGHRPRLHFDGWSGFIIHFGASYIEISGFDIQGGTALVSYDYCNAERGNDNPRCSSNGISIDGRDDPVKKPHHIRLARNHIWECPGGGIAAVQADYLTIEDNVVHDNAFYSRYGQSGISLYQAWNSDDFAGTKNFVRRNRSYHNRSTIPWFVTNALSDGDGIIIDDFRNTQNNSANGVYKGRTLVENNLCYDNGGGGVVIYSSDHVDVVNNTTRNNGDLVFYPEIFVNQASDVHVLNNILYSRTGGSLTKTEGYSDLSVNYNLYFYAGRLDIGRTGPNDKIADPLFAGADDFHLLPGSPALASGGSLLAPADDLDGIARPAGGKVSRGAYETVISDAVSFSADGLLNAASFLGGSIAPGELVTIYGRGFGAEPITVARYGPSGWLPVEVGGTRVLFDGVFAPMIYSLSGQVSAIVPYGVAGTSKVQVQAGMLRSRPVEVPVQRNAPGVYCYSGGKGQAVAVSTNPDRSAGFNIDKPVQRGGTVTLFLTGEGAVTPSWADGHLPVSPSFPNPAQPLQVAIGGVESRCPGNWAGLIYAGVTQMNVCVPAGASSGDAVPVSVAGSLQTVTIRVE